MEQGIEKEEKSPFYRLPMEHRGQVKDRHTLTGRPHGASADAPASCETQKAPE